jgi:glycosyltransferase involved in cell wall biosynthesis
MLIEALSCGVPVIASDSGEIPDVLADAGVVVGEGDEQAWMRTLRDLLDDTVRLGRLSCRGRQMAVERFAWHVIARQHLEFFNEIVDLRRQN